MDKKAKVISILNFKGGVGKTTTTLNLGAALAKRGMRVLLIDLDIQMNTSYILGYSTKDGESIYELMSGTAKEFPIYDTKTEGLQFIPSSMKLDVLANELNGRISRETILRRALQPLMGYYDYILMDCPPGRSIFTDNAMTASSSILIPITCEEINKQGIATMLVRYKDILDNLNEELTIEGFLLTKYNKQYRVSREMRDDLERSGLKVMQTAIRMSMSLNTYCKEYQNVFDFDTATFKPGYGRKPEPSNGAADYMALADEIMAQ